MKTFWNRLPSLGSVLHRFPMAAAVMAVFTLIIIFNSRIRFDESLWRMLIGLIVGAYLCVIITLVREVTQRSRLYAVQALTVIILATLFWFSNSLRINAVMALGAVLLMLGNAVGWRQVRDDLHIWDFTHKIWTSAVLATVGSIIFLLGALSIEFALKTLLGVSINDLIEDFIIPLGLGFLAPLYWLSTVPRVDEAYDELYENPGFVSKAIGFLGTWLLAPLSMIYAVIILIYGAKILVTMSLPKGEIATLTLPFLFIGTLTWLLLEPPFIQKTTLARWFRWLWFPISIPVAILLAVAIAVRISLYGYTEERFALALAVIWALAIGVWFTLKKEGARDIRLIPGIGAALLAVGTFMAEPISINSQTLRAKAIVSELGLVTDKGDLTALKMPNLEQKEQLQSLKGKLAYLYRKKTPRSIRRVFPNGKDIGEAADVYESLGIENISVHNGPAQPIIDFTDYDDFLTVSGFDHISHNFNYYIGNGSWRERNFSDKDSAIQVTLDRPNLSVIHEDGHETIIDIIEAVKGFDGNEKTPVFIDADKRTRIHFKAFRIRRNAETDALEVSDIQFRVLTKNAEPKDEATKPNP